MHLELFSGESFASGDNYNILFLTFLGHVEMKHLLLTTIAAVLLVGGESKESSPSVEVKKIEPLPEESGVSIMTFNTEWLLGSQTQVEALKKKGIWGLENKDTESEIEQQHQSVATIVARHAPDILCLQEVINEVAAKRLQKALQGKGLQYALHFLESRDTHLEQDVVFLTNKSSGNITNIKASHPIDPVYPSKCVILTCLINGEQTAIIGLHLKAVPTEPSAVAKREKQADAVVKQLNRLSAAGYATLVLGDLNDWDPIVPDADPSEQATPTSQALKKMKDYVPGGDNELVNSLKWVEPMEKRYTYNYKGSKTVLDHILLPLGWQDRVSGVTIDHDRPDGASDHWPVILDLSW